MQLALILYIRHIQFIFVQCTDHNPSQSIYFFSHHHLLILQISIVYKLYVIHEQYTSVVSVLPLTPNSTTILPKSYPI